MNDTIDMLEICLLDFKRGKTSDISGEDCVTIKTLCARNTHHGNHPQ